LGYVRGVGVAVEGVVEVGRVGGRSVASQSLVVGREGQ
jgi:hypothetical protein